MINTGVTLIDGKGPPGHVAGTGDVTMITRDKDGKRRAEATGWSPSASFGETFCVSGQCAGHAGGPQGHHQRDNKHGESMTGTKGRQ